MASSLGHSRSLSSFFACKAAQHQSETSALLAGAAIEAPQGALRPREVHEALVAVHAVAAKAVCGICRRTSVLLHHVIPVLSFAATRAA